MREISTRGGVDAILGDLRNNREKKEKNHRGGGGGGSFSHVKGGGGKREGNRQKDRARKVTLPLGSEKEERRLRPE